MDALRNSLSALGETVKATGADLGKKVSEGMTVVGGRLGDGVTVVSDRVKDMLKTPTDADKLVDEATSDTLIGPDLEKGLYLCDLVNSGRLPVTDVVQAMKRRLITKHPHSQFLALNLLEMMVKNCSRMFAAVASEKVLDEMVKMSDDKESPVQIREKVLRMIEAWGEASNELRFLPVYEETYKSMKSRGVVFPARDPESLVPIFTPSAGPHYVPPGAVPAGAVSQAPMFIARLPTQYPPAASDPKEALAVASNSVELLSTVLTSSPRLEVLQDDVTRTLVAQCTSSQRTVESIIHTCTSESSESTGEQETLMLEALSIHDELEKTLNKYRDMQREVAALQGNGETESERRQGTGISQDGVEAGRSAAEVDQAVEEKNKGAAEGATAAAMSMDDVEEGETGESELVRHRGARASIPAGEEVGHLSGIAGGSAPSRSEGTTTSEGQAEQTSSGSAHSIPSSGEDTMRAIDQVVFKGQHSSDIAAEAGAGAGAEKNGAKKDESSDTVIF